MYDSQEEMDGKETPSNGSTEGKGSEQRGKNGNGPNSTNGTNGASVQNGQAPPDAAIIGTYFFIYIN